MGETVTVLRLRIITIFSAPLIHLSDFLLEFSFSVFRLLILSLEFTLSVSASVTVPICLFLLFPLSFLLILCQSVFRALIICPFLPIMPIHSFRFANMFSSACMIHNSSTQCQFLTFSVRSVRKEKKLMEVLYCFLNYFTISNYVIL